MTDTPRMRPGRRRLGPLAAVVLLCMLALTAAAAVGVWHYQSDRERDTRQEWAQRAARELEGQVGQTGTALVGIRGLFAASNRVDKGEFQRFAAIQLDGSSLLGLTWTPRVTAAGRESYERATGRPITDGTPGGGFRGAADRAEYFPLRFLEPETPESARAIGVDAVAAVGTVAALGIARDTGRLALSTAIALGATEADRGTALVAAVYRTGAPLRTVAERRAALRGVVSGTWRYDRLAAPILTLLPEGADLEITDAGEPVFGALSPATQSATETTTLGGRTWAVRVGLPQTGARWVELAGILGGGLILTVLVGLLFVQATGRRRERETAHEELHHEANTDSLTGLGNRRKLRADFARAGDATTDRPTGLIMFDLNGFKGYNDTFGHPAGDALLARLGGRLAAALPGGEAYRLGGDEFCTLFPVGPEGLDPIVTSSLAALTEEGEGFTISSAHGAVLLPRDARSLAEAMLLGDQRMYQQKARGRSSASRQSADVLMKVLIERSPELRQHLDGVSALAESVGQRMGLEPVTLGHLVRAAGLHDVGKVAIPESILTKPGPLDEREMTFVRGHTLIGARILLAAPSLAPEARLVRASHERWDGGGYPDRLTGEQIPLGARIIFACDAFEAMTSAERPYRVPVSAELALEELRRCAGTQFDPQVVKVLEEVVRARPQAPDGGTGTDPERRHPDTRGRPRRA